MKILVTGSKGQLGTELLALLGERHEVVGLDLPECDLTDRDQVLGAVCGFEPDLVLHGAAFTAVDVCESRSRDRLPGELVRHPLPGRRRPAGRRPRRVRLDRLRVRRHEDRVRTSSGTPPNPQSVYGASKLGGEHEIDPSWTIARTSWVCSAHGNNMVKTRAEARRGARRR